ncbi:MAG TPA: ATP-dependent protease, Lon family [Clostridiales bacterium]|nr:ATP-dependent protease, Lon family [Clostridiales bacterium]
MEQSSLYSKDQLLDVLIDYSKKIYGEMKLSGIEDLKDPKEKVMKLREIIIPEEEFAASQTEEELSNLLEIIRDKLSDKAARVYTENLIKREILNKIQQNEKEYLNQIKLQIIKKHCNNCENSSTLKKYADLEKKKSITLSRQISDILRPQKEDEIIGQSKGVKSLISKIASPFPQHVIIYGPPGVGKTSAARIALKLAKEKEYSPFRKDAPFIEVNGATLRWDPREAVNPLLGSVHDPIYQGAKKDLSEVGIPEPKPGMVTEAHGGILFIDEIGELDEMLQNKLLKVLEDKKVSFESSYYDENSDEIPKYIHMLFKEGAPADFILIGATTRRPEEINPALRSRCAEIFFEPLSPEDIQDILENGANRLGISIDEDAKELISRCVYDARKAINVLLDCYSSFLYENPKDKVVIDYDRARMVLGPLVRDEYNLNRMGKEIGKIYGAGVSRYYGSIIEFEALAFKREDERGSVRFNETAGSMIRDSLFNALTVLKYNMGINPDEYDIHVNCVGGAKVDGPSAGLALTCLLYSAIMKKPVPKDCCITGEISITGDVKAVGGVREKINAAIREGFKYMLIPYGNKKDAADIKGINIVYVGNIKEVVEFLTR